MSQLVLFPRVLSRRLWSPASSLAGLPAAGSARVEPSLCRRCLEQCHETIQHVGARYSLRAWDLDDFMQDAWLAILTAVAGGRYDPRRGSLAGWLHIVARNRAVTFYRRNRRSNQGAVQLPLEAVCGPIENDPASLCARRWKIERVRQAMRQLEQRISPLGFAIFYLRRMEQCTVAEVAANLRITCDQVRAHDCRARRKLAQLVSRDDRI